MDPQDQQNKPSGFVILTMEILEDKSLSTAEKFVLARITGFDKAEGHYESVENTAAALGLSKRSVQYARKHLEELGYIETVGITDLGTKLIRIKSFHPDGAQKMHPGAKTALENGGAKSAPGCKICHSGVQNLHPIIKGEERISLKDKSFKEAQAPGDESEEVQLNEEIPKRYGNAEVNEILDEWEEATGFSWHSTKQERFATNTLLRKYGSDATKALVRRVQRARRANDQFAPQIAKPSQLLGKYEKLTALTMWEERQTKAEAKEAEAHAPAYVPEYMRMPDGPRQEYVDVRPETPEEKAEAHRKAMEIRAKLPFYVPKEQRKAGC